MLVNMQKEPVGKERKRLIPPAIIIEMFMYCSFMVFFQQVSKWEQYLSSPTELGSGKDASSDEEEQFGHPAIYKSR